ncbi:cytosolic endo-beta-N-acetylglucosaminidase [Euwallacea fornicatus]|uniref:cytosolic endo-beta-N-acetylglucosaminidase n=1 Tax=Euwallacea fornicatus TaxID=995702 RepID=UPI00338E8400
MIPSFTQCRPIVKYSDIEDCLINPPEWVKQIQPLKERSSHIIKNALSDCHCTENTFRLRPRIDCRAAPKTLVCHDYKGGYQADSYVPFDNHEDKTLATDGYTFYNWSQVDYFVYFSHYFITIPPLAWINAGHRNGVKVLGTIITENQDGVKICNEEIFNNHDQMKEFVYRLTEIQKIFGFDGWLLNIENTVQNPELLRDFVEILTLQTHLQNSENVIIWYDSVTKDGNLKWQDQLNNLNRCFFDCCDGIFLNYSWNEEKLENTAALAGARQFDVFVGVDVFGRNMFGGGQFNTYKAAQIIRKYNLSMAIFAPGWTHETMTKTAEEADLCTFLNRDDALWATLWPYLYTHPINNFFETDFHVGLDFNNYNLYIQKFQMSWVLSPEDLTSFANNLQENISDCYCLKRAYWNSRNVCSISDEKLCAKNNSEKFIHRLFSCDIQLSGRIGVFCLTKKLNVAESTIVDISMLTCYKSGSVRTIHLLGERKALPVDNSSCLEVAPLTDKEVIYNNYLNSIAKRFFKVLSKPKDRGCIILSMYEFTTTSCDLLEIGATIRNGTTIHLIEFGIIQL